MSGRRSTNRHRDHVRRKDSFEAGEITTLGSCDQAVEKTPLLGRTRGYPSATGDVLPSATHYVPRVCFNEIAVGDQATLEGLTQFLTQSLDPRRPNP